MYQSGQPTQRTDYLGPFQYEGDSLRFFPHAEGRVLRVAATDAAGQTSVRYEREFSFKDHLGNLRLAYRLGHVRTLATSLNLDDATGHAREAQQFDSLSVSAPVAQRVGNLARSDQFAARLNAGGSAPQPLGPLAQLAVQQGDTVTVTAYGLYTQPVQHNLLFPLASFLTNLLHPAQGLPAAGPDPSRGRAGLPLLQVGVATGLASLPQLPGGVPKGYLRVLVFNADSGLVRQYSQQLSGAALNSYQALRQRVVVGQDGYVSAFVGNESDADVLFDDLTVEHRPGVQVQEVEYDPAGLELAGLGTSTPGLKSLSQYKFNGKEFQADLGLNWTQLDWRMVDPQLGGGFHSVDPDIENGQESMSPYAFGYDNAVRFNDPDGRGPGDKILGFAAAVVDNVSLGLTNVRSIAAEHVSNGSDFNQGQNYGDTFSFLYALGEQGGGNAASAGGLALAETGGGLVVAAGGQVVALHGRGMAVLAVGNLLSQKGRVPEPAKGSEEKPHDTPRQARRDAMRKEGIPTSQQPIAQSKTRAGRTQTYEVPKPGGGKGTKQVQQQTTDEGHGPHFEAGKTKEGGQKDGLGRDRLQNGKSKSFYQ